MKTEFERISEIMYTLLAHEPVIDVPYEKINDIAVALVKDGYGDISEYEAERKMLGSKIKVLKQRLNDKYIEVDNLNRDYRNAFERLKAQEREIEQLKDDYAKLQEQFAQYQMASDKEIMAQRKQAQIDVLNELREKYATSNSVGSDWATIIFVDDIDELIKEIEQ